MVSTIFSFKESSMTAERHENVSWDSIGDIGAAHL